MACPCRWRKLRGSAPQARSGRAGIARPAPVRRPTPARAPGDGSARVLEGASATAVGLRHDLVAGRGLEQRGAPLRAPGVSLRCAPLDADFDVVAARGLQVEVQARFSIGPVGQLIEGGRFEAAAHRPIDMHLGRPFKHQPRHRQGRAVMQAAAVVAVGAHHVMVLRRELNTAVPHTRGQAPAGCELPDRLQVRVQIGDHVVFIAPQCALYAQRGPNEVLPAAPLLLHAVVGQAGHDFQRAI